MARVRTAKFPKPGELEAEEQEAQPKVSQAEAVRQALAAGMDAPADGVEFIKTHFGIEMDNKRFSLAKSQQKARDAKKEAASKPSRKPRAASQAVGGSLAPPTRAVDGEAGLIEILEALKPLIAQHGVEKVKRLADLLG